MKKFSLVFGSVLVLSTSAALAGSFTAPVVEPPVYSPPVSQAYNWTGGYVGVGLTYGRGTHSVGGGAPLVAPNSTGPGLGVLMGYNWQNGGMVVGGEVSGVFSRMNGTNDCGLPPLECESRINNFASARLRLGVAMDNTLLFMTAGYATDVQRHTISLGGVEVASQARRYNGPVVGVGVEHGFSREWTVRGDLEHYRLGTENFFGGVPVTARTNLARLSIVRRF
ncbi:MAG: porin family protein [Pararhodobacter sp.]|nr:porin family protein [Pararhodobacter sp.]